MNIIPVHFPFMRCVILPSGGSAATQNGFAQILAVHAALLQNGKIVYFSGDQHDPGQHVLGLFDHARLFDCNTLSITSPAAAPGIRDLFCCGHAFLPDGRLLVAGGTEAWTTEVEAGGDPHGHAAAGHFRGTVDAYVFDSGTNQWSGVNRLVPEPGLATGGGRWYPTLVTLGNGSVAAFSGHPSNSDTRHYNDTVETFSTSPAPSGQWTDKGTVPVPLPGYPELTYYPRCHLLPDGTLFFSSPINGQSMRWNPTTQVWSAICAGPGNDYDGIGSNSVLLPLLHDDAYRPKVLVCGRIQAQRIDLGSATPGWSPTLARTLMYGGSPPVRTHCNSVLLPTGEVVTCGGQTDPGNDPAAAVLEIEIYRPATNSWATMPAATNAQVSRNYHSVALLMPDGRVWMAGSNKRANWSFHNSADYPAALPTDAQEGTVDNRELRIELFEPWYFGRPDRPTFTGSPSQVSVNGTFTINSPQAATVSRVAVIRAGSSTHSFNPDQRYVGLPFTRAGNVLTVTLPDNENVLPPGYYLLYILSTVVDPTLGVPLDVPSLGTFIRIDNAKAWKELKWEIKEWKELEKYHLKAEVDVHKLEFEIPDPKLIAEGDPFNVGDPVVNPAQILRMMAERLDNLERKQGVGKAFIQPAERPPVQVSVRKVAALQRTPPPTADELAMRDPHRHEGHPGDRQGHQHAADHAHNHQSPKKETGSAHSPKAKDSGKKKRGKK